MAVSHGTFIRALLCIIIADARRRGFTGRLTLGSIDITDVKCPEVE